MRVNVLFSKLLVKRFIGLNNATKEINFMHHACKKTRLEYFQRTRGRPEDVKHEMDHNIVFMSILIYIVLRSKLTPNYIIVTDNG